jgi:hypothetical protein
MAVISNTVQIMQVLSIYSFHCPMYFCSLGPSSSVSPTVYELVLFLRTVTRFQTHFYFYIHVWSNCHGVSEPFLVHPVNTFCVLNITAMNLYRKRTSFRPHLIRGWPAEQTNVTDDIGVFVASLRFLVQDAPPQPKTSSSARHVSLPVTSLLWISEPPGCCHLRCHSVTRMRSVTASGP